MSTQLTPPGMGRCEITGKIVPEDELVTINGQRVCAEGKAILLEQMKSGEALPGEAERPTVLRRFGCIFLDQIIIGVPSMILMFVAAGGAIFAGGAAAAAGVAVGVAQLLVVIISVAYFTFMHGSRSQTLGKMAGKLRVIRMDGQPMNMNTAFIRALAYTGVQAIPAITIMIGIPGLQLGMGFLVNAYAIINVVMALVDRSTQRALHDRIAGTRVIVAG